MNLKGIRLSETSQAEKDKYRMTSLIFGILKKKKSNSQKQTVGWWLLVAEELGRWGNAGQRYKPSTVRG